MTNNSLLLDTLESIINGEMKVLKTEKAGDQEGKVLEITTQTGVLCFSVDIKKNQPEWVGSVHLVPNEEANVAE